MMALVKSGLEESGLKKEDIDDIVFVGGSTRIPKVQKLLKDLFDGKEPSNAAGVNPDEVLLKSCFIIPQLTDPYDISMLEVSANTLGIQTVGGVMTKLIRMNAIMPARNKGLFTTNRDNQTTAEIMVFNGEMRFAKDCREIGRFNITGILPAPRGVPRIEISSEFGLNGGLDIIAKDKRSRSQRCSLVEPTIRMFVVELLDSLIAKQNTVLSM